ncbi:MAG: hypothetical protein GF317_13445 [Candidatus Lokiarchaeota archaeon]|nr:hypothetical protein [Candidatus Lokiarchaeota archaeon]MBD3200642.1 hypothetical protein [Candidatus Lokiarchaeota archaeon]
MLEERTQDKNNKDLRLFNDALEYFKEFEIDESSISSEDIDEIYPDNSENRLRDEMLNELNNLKDLILNTSNSKIKELSDEEREIFNKFIKFYDRCPVCGNLNHYFNLKKAFFDENFNNMRKLLINLMNFESPKLTKFQINMGIPCCRCYKSFFNEE